ncbi:Auxin-responsive protein SAUR71 [Striga hermonthica]|uniref:Auxin-responsive protein SAUR71 n=1 Tax=Striga hermonthica TaxID=68872 RepID=A0A9N7MVX8_STRHE|nr:Auxin-responsive protein SAUR71 [Striga hermonthica]
MKKLMRRLSRVGDCGPVGVPEGHLPVYVGEEMERFVVGAELLNHPIFVKLLNRSAQEYGYDHQGVLRIPCRVLVFQRVLDALGRGRKARGDAWELLGSLADEL